MRFFYDTEFIDDGLTISLISIGIVAEDGRELYAVSNGFSMARAVDHPFVGAHVLPYLPMRNTGRTATLDETSPLVHPKRVIADMVRDFLLADGEPELWAYCAAYDHVALAQLFGPMAALPKGIPWFTNDIKTLWIQAGRPALPEQKSCHHHALHDARYDQEIYNFLQDQIALTAAGTTLSRDARAVVAGLVAPTAAVPGGINQDGIGYDSGIAAEIRRAFPIADFWAWARRHCPGATSPATFEQDADGIGYYANAGQ